jgi:hypothetical protein
MLYREGEGLTLILARATAEERGLAYDGPRVVKRDSHSLWQGAKQTKYSTTASENAFGIAFGNGRSGGMRSGMLRVKLV